MSSKFKSNYGYLQHVLGMHSGWVLNCACSFASSAFDVFMQLSQLFFLIVGWGGAILSAKALNVSDSPSEKGTPATEDQCCLQRRLGMEHLMQGRKLIHH